MDLKIRVEQMVKLIENGFDVNQCKCGKHLVSIYYKELPVFKLERELGFTELYIRNSNFNEWCGGYLKNNISEYHKLDIEDVYHLNCTLDDYIDFIIRVKNESQKKPDTILILSKMSWD